MVAKKMERVLLIMWFVSLVFVCIIGYREIINAVPYGLKMASKIVSENKDVDYLLWNGNRPQIKRKKFEQLIDRLSVV